MILLLLIAVVVKILVWNENKWYEYCMWFAFFQKHIFRIIFAFPFNRIILTSFQLQIMFDHKGWAFDWMMWVDGLENGFLVQREISVYKYDSHRDLTKTHFKI
jgi:hypothetical protein